MKTLVTTFSMGLILLLTGCGQGTSVGPGAKSPPEKGSALTQTNNTFSLTMAPVELRQGERKLLDVKIARGTGFKGDVILKVEGLPQGVTTDDTAHFLSEGTKETKIALKADIAAALGDYKFKLSGQPTSGANAVNEVKLVISKQVLISSDASTDATAQASRDQDVSTMQAILDQFTIKYDELASRAAKAEGEAKIALEVRTASAKVKLDEASAKLAELKSAGADNWEKLKKGLNDAFEELKKSFA